MTKAVVKRTIQKNARESKSFVVNCGGVLWPGETIDAVDDEAIVITYADGAALDGGDGFAIQGATKNAAQICEPGETPVPIAEGIQGFFVGGVAGKTYAIAIPFTTTDGQDLDAEIMIAVV
ncbi:MAG: hypothetical protein ACIALR_12905 [Blastopirellula sp. JB062]